MNPLPTTRFPSPLPSRSDVRRRAQAAAWCAALALFAAPTAAQEGPLLAFNAPTPSDSLELERLAPRPVSEVGDVRLPQPITLEPAEAASPWIRPFLAAQPARTSADVGGTSVEGARTSALPARTSAATDPGPRVVLGQPRRVVLLPGVSEREASEGVTSGPARWQEVGREAAPDVRRDPASNNAEAFVRVGLSGERTVTFRERPVVATAYGVGTSGRRTGSACAASAGGVVLDEAALRGLRTTPLRYGMRGPAVRAAQLLLCAAGYDLEVDGLYGGWTVAVVKGFQRNYNASDPPYRLRVDGKIGQDTRQALEAVARAAAPGQDLRVR